MICDTQSNASFKSRNTPPNILPVSKAIDTILVKTIMAWVVLCRFLNQNYLLYKMSWSSRKSITESNILKINDNTEIGL